MFKLEGWSSWSEAKRKVELGPSVTAVVHDHSLDPRCHNGRRFGWGGVLRTRSFQTRPVLAFVFRLLVTITLHSSLCTLSLFRCDGGSDVVGTPVAAVARRPVDSYVPAVID